MVALKAGDVDRFLARPPADVPLILVYGPDVGLVSERASALVQAASGGTDDPFSLVKLDAGEVVSDPSRLIDEALTIPLFGGRRVVWVRDGAGKNLVPAVEPLLGQLDPANALVVIEAGDLKKGVGLRKKVEADRGAVAIPCYVDAERDLEKLIDGELRAAELSISREARMALMSLLGADRLASRGEVQKLCLYAHGRERIEVADVEAIIGDASAFAVDELIDAAALGDLKTLDHGLERLEAAGMRPDVLANMALRHFQFLARARAEVDRGVPANQVISQSRPPVFFKRQPAVSRQVMLWRASDLSRAGERLAAVVAEARKVPTLGAALVSDVLLILARVARQRARR
ncbi:DNA polymerase III subunit delta [Stappia taiwanensis]|uniref:DNA polymerase III subunit delta n=1 Tax=Stappia taiwanensis TaxID=992267 RepID=A0A838XM37_9HYPH|nr:DNA polymerase III subunit delta [Stappia taiwanensis]MBA4611565.1 DNA polymerase III subunit delta [Stappia taiwanensis]GGE99272.1 DNA polymerase III subunit delta [Stappia taiwanensis]